MTKNSIGVGSINGPVNPGPMKTHSSNAGQVNADVKNREIKQRSSTTKRRKPSLGLKISAENHEAGYETNDELGKSYHTKLTCIFYS